jgi:hypothetical protein
MKKFLFILALLMTIPGFSQSLNDYQYLIVPIKYESFKENDKFRLNSLTKAFFVKYGFKTFLSNEAIPEEVNNKRCTALSAALVLDNGMFMTKVKLQLKDCKDNLVFETDFGSSRSKDFNVAYNQALREALQSFNKVAYKYNGKNDSGTTETSVATASSDTPQDKAPESPTTTTENNPELFFFAQPIANGFQIVDSEPRVIMRLFNTSQKNVFIGLKEDTHGVVILKNNQWFFEYYENSKLVSEPLKLRF